MSQLDDILSQFPAKHPHELLGALAELRARARTTASLPLATFHFRSGRDFTGWLLNVERRATALVSISIQLRSSDRGPQDSVVYADPQNLDAITFHDSATAAVFLSFGAIDIAPGTTAPNRMELKKRSPSLQESVRAACGCDIAIEIAWDDIANQPEALLQLQRLIEETVEVFHALGGEYSPDDLSAAVDTLRFCEGDAGARRENRCLAVRARFAQGAEGRLRGDALRAAIEAAL